MSAHDVAKASVFIVISEIERNPICHPVVPEAFGFHELLVVFWNESSQLTGVPTTSCGNTQTHGSKIDVSRLHPRYGQIPPIGIQLDLTSEHIAHDRSFTELCVVKTERIEAEHYAQESSTPLEESSVFGNEKLENSEYLLHDLVRTMRITRAQFTHDLQERVRHACVLVGVRLEQIPELVSIVVVASMPLHKLHQPFMVEPDQLAVEHAFVHTRRVLRPGVRCNTHLHGTQIDRVHLDHDRPGNHVALMLNDRGLTSSPIELVPDLVVVDVIDSHDSKCSKQHEQNSEGNSDILGQTKQQRFEIHHFLLSMRRKFKEPCLSIEERIYRKIWILSTLALWSACVRACVN